MASARTIELLLTDGSLGGLLRAELLKWNGVMFSSPRDTFSQLSKHGESKFWGIYLLLSDDKVYVGQSNDLLRRITEHEKAKDWWTRVVILTTTNDSLVKSDIDWLEYHLIEKANLKGTLDVDNKVKGNTPKVSVFRAANLNDYLEGGLLLIELIGIKVFSENNSKLMSKPISIASPTRQIVFRQQNHNKRHVNRDVQKLVGRTMYYRTDAGSGFHSKVEVVKINKFVLLAGSTIQPANLDTIWPDKIKILEERNQFVQKGFLDGTKVLKDIEFTSLNRVATFIRGQNVNAWISFVDSNGMPIDDIARI